MSMAWAAGLFEGEGCIAAHKRGKRGSGIQLRLGMTDRDAVQRFAAVVGAGTIYKPRRKRPHEKQLHDWALYESAEVVRVLELLLPWFCERRRAKALEALEIARDISVHKGKKTHCPNGHPYDGDNLRLEPIQGGKYMARRCVTCRRAQERERMRKRLNIPPERWRITEPV